MIKKIDLILGGSLGIFFGTSLKSGHYYIDIYLNILSFPLFLFGLIYMIYLYKLQGKLNKKLLLSIIAFICSSVYLSIYLFFVELGLFSFLYFLYSSKKSDSLEYVDIDIYSLPIIITKNKGFFHVEIVVVVTLVYYCILSYLYLICQCIKVIPEFW